MLNVELKGIDGDIKGEIELPKSCIDQIQRYVNRSDTPESTVEETIENAILKVVEGE